ncbi:phosphotriesterase-related protein isoform X2 [Bacillus rossius redtenbacheri]
MSQEDIFNVIITEMTEGCLEDSTVKCGFIGEVASDWPISDFEKRSIQATAEAQSSLGCAVSFHPGRDPKAPFEIIRLFQEAGGDVQKAVMSHLDRTLSQSEQLEFAALGAYCQQDLFGTECSYYQLHPMYDMPSDAQRLSNVTALLREGREDRVLMSHDIHTKHRLMDYGGHGYAHILINIVHKMLAKGIPQQVIDKITIKNPQNWLSIKQ